jgi:hypothetical protein
VHLCVPGFAVCRHPSQILTKLDSLGSLLERDFDLKLEDLRYLTAFEKAELNKVNTIKIYRRFAFNNSGSVSSLVLSSRGQYAGIIKIIQTYLTLTSNLTSLILN